MSTEVTSPGSRHRGGHRVKRVLPKCYDITGIPRQNCISSKVRNLFIYVLCRKFVVSREFEQDI